MGDDERSFPQVKTRLEELASEAAKKDTPLEKCLDLLEEGERLARRCTELIDQTEWRAAAGEQEPDEAEEGSPDASDEEPDEARAEDPEAGGDSAEEPAEEASEASPAVSPEDEEPEESEQDS